ncbi:hypothetical protein HPB48_008728 [Haemaphysalis longicornis]|uniref:Peptidase M13 N-terminal domain-containing protein n=1 Tax=Haemaphysalis longicornis TaxID=44386 RepID=A0A9J6H5S5_HAELO|nr:hypothetical protein HPB48_008728 [Haemaphysalis longicornis]
MWQHGACLQPDSDTSTQRTGSGSRRRSSSSRRLSHGALAAHQTDPCWPIAGFVLGVVLIAVLILAFADGDRTEVPVCHSWGCAHAAEQLAGSLNRSVDPCDDFYRFVCDGWERTHRDSVSLFDRAASQLRAKVEEDALAVEIPNRHQYAQEKAAIFYHSCVQSMYRGDSEFQLFLDLQRSLHLPWPHNSTDPRTDPLGIVVDLSVNYGVTFYFSLHLRQRPGAANLSALPRIVFRSKSANFAYWLVKQSMISEVILTCCSVPGRYHTRHELMKHGIYEQYITSVIAVFLPNVSTDALRERARHFKDVDDKATVSLLPTLTAKVQALRGIVGHSSLRVIGNVANGQAPHHLHVAGVPSD